MKDSEDLLVRREDGVLVLTFNRPAHRNALTQEMQTKLGEELAAAELDHEIGCILLTGAGGAFCAGGDVKNMARGHAAGQSIDQLRRMEAQRQSQRRMSLRLFEMGKPTLAALPGATAGVGLSMALACDMRIAADTAIMSTAFVNGLSGNYGGTYLLTQLAGPAKARELYLLGDRIDKTEAFRLGLVNWVVPAADLEAKALEIARRLAEPHAAPRHRRPQGSRSRFCRETAAPVHRALGAVEVTEMP
jgi:2-(1,2-epoxy-1,2-dihydrophenyl)acetyl-CoA isomerase